MLGRRSRREKRTEKTTWESSATPSFKLAHFLVLHTDGCYFVDRLTTVYCGFNKCDFKK
jgi:hypothetical protein